MDLSDAPEVNIEFLMCDDIEMEANNTIDNNALVRDPLADISEIRLHPSSIDTLSSQIVSNDPTLLNYIQKNGNFNVTIYLTIVCIEFCFIFRSL